MLNLVSQVTLWKHAVSPCVLSPDVQCATGKETLWKTGSWEEVMWYLGLHCHEFLSTPSHA